MITFQCEHCEQKIRVAKEASGRKGRCPKCRQTVTVPAPPTDELQLKVDPAVSIPKPPGPQIQYECQMCKNQLTAPKTDMGNIRECPNCGCFVEVPNPYAKPDTEEDGPIQVQSRPDEANEYVDPLGRHIPLAAKQKPTRRLPIFLDVFLYPLSKSGLMMLVGFVLGPVILYPLVFLPLYGPLIYLGLMVCITAYMFWYFSLCIQKSAEGDVRAPDTFNQDSGIEMWDMIVQMLRTLLLIFLCLLLPFVYSIVTGSGGIVFFAILVACIFFLPMFLLASVMFDSFWIVFNPRVILGGIFSSFFQYLVLVIAFYIPISIYVYIESLEIQQENRGIILALALNAVSIYLFMVSSHLLGWYFYKNEEKLYWSV